MYQRYLVWTEDRRGLLRLEAQATINMSGHNKLEAKIVVLGSQGVGKTSLVNRFVKNAFAKPGTIQSTIGASFLTKRVIDIDSSTTCQLQIWDTAGQERFKSITKLYYRGANAALLCYDITSAQSFEEMGHWLVELKEQLPSDTVVHVVGTKADIVAMDPSKRKVPFERCIAYVAENLYPAQYQNHGQAQTRGRDHQQRPVTAMPGPNTADYFSPQHSSDQNSAQKKPAHSRSKSASTLLTALTKPSQLNPSQSSPQDTAPTTPFPQMTSPTSNRSSMGFWGQDLGWDCCHEVSASSGEGVEEVFRVITRRLVDQRNNRAALEQRLAEDFGGMLSPGSERGGYFSDNGSTGDPYGHGVSGNGSFRVGYGDKRRSWMGLPAFGGGVDVAGSEAGGDGVAVKRKGCC